MRCRTGKSAFLWGTTQNEHFTPLGSPFIESTVKNISTKFASPSSSVQLFSYEVSSTDFVYSIYRVDIGAIDLYTNEALVDDWRLFNITHTI